ncbi:naphthalene 1,2-dioxygenase system ferredoxin subunit [Cupriavidus necator N-1]|jgi:naphthalene 1,2-dioxygenase ferredoxin component|uniref:Naphthalene 1,2-dioxygenase system ferredoxin subunit n=1 Tax=Cupriavidus necator (strain ATCC 43291 / DSM 13513 / CCUG 52238 / LMG 8453 / N-1) TaxID=1042878 RepID=G0EUZ6_CUPNN|nr:MULTISPECIES: non-heme iron oxygenase ferredoxin subunit [Cupriavidus]AEI76982.1 naphthalene 1,2-dioxygenase system ferredoxin subunit [Cupriavidus necator N-1]KAI3600859.1 putative ferredoxin subunit of a ring-hydroxylating dioxygenase oxidoreductase protein [Cupriavidus necator H850]MDX6014456.1 non-heme iron oxygenase ferredoxin subunit [Cupriavidus necator]QUN29899.1 non-heme iron oxygenase ferredoxin subunit [Cupriavidus sp. KK10]
MTESWIEAALLSDVPQDDVIAVAVQGQEIALYGVDGDVYATDNICTHGHARLCEGFLEGHEIECPLHQGRFDIRSGAAKCAPLTENIRTYPVRIDGDKVYLDLG